jgi:hypothetical protein
VLVASAWTEGGDGVQVRREELSSARDEAGRPAARIEAFEALCGLRPPPLVASGRGRGPAEVGSSPGARPADRDVRRG